MNVRQVIVFLLCSIGMRALSQTPSVIPSPKLDVYANFVGDWVGTVKKSDHGVMVTTSVELSVAESPKKNSMRFDYTYEKKDENHYRDISRIMTLDPKTSKVTSQYKGDNKEASEAVGLAEFAETGYGSFVVSRKERSDAYPFYRCTFSLTPNTFSYQPEVSSDGKTFMPTSVYTFTRKTSNATNPSPN
ncbi:hypothetical protein RBB77_10065 [Tunturibacter psychrotolerans]|uniref:DUF1579 domain-containing protein n=1 Tax=Tunturiibacter psychrotolerans TaxID=3069686 RepID=A0AAU7ZW07_9BACT